MPRRLLGLLSVLIALDADPAAAADHPVQLSLITPIQIYPPSDTITGFRFSLLYGRNQGMKGFDIGLVAHVEYRGFMGVQWSLVGLDQGDFLGWQAGGVNWVGKTMTGLQLGMVNIAERVEGVQFGLVNYTGTIHGLQIGLVNIIRQGGFLPVCIIVNGSF